MHIHLTFLIWTSSAASSLSSAEQWQYLTSSRSAVLQNQCELTFNLLKANCFLANKVTFYLWRGALQKAPLGIVRF